MACKQLDKDSIKDLSDNDLKSVYEDLSDIGHTEMLEHVKEEIHRRCLNEAFKKDC